MIVSTAHTLNLRRAVLIHGAALHSRGAVSARVRLLVL